MPRIVNAQITEAMVRISDRELLELYVSVAFQGGFCGVVEGHHALYLPPTWDKHRPESLLGHIIWKWLNVTDCKEVSKMVGKVVRVKLDHELSTIPSGVGHAIRDDRWFCTQDICQANKPGGSE